MLIGQRLDENEREKKIKKTQLYREMLDNQILMNEQYRKQHPEKGRERENDSFVDHAIMPTVIRKPSQDLQQSIVHEMDHKQSRPKNRFLPLLKDKNTFYRGSSRFLKVQTENKTYLQTKKRTNTQQIEEEDSQQSDYYDSTCQRIIKELQSIKNKPVKFRARKRLYDFSQLQVQRRTHDKNPSTQERYEAQEQQNTQTFMKNKNYKAFHNPESRYYRYLSTDLAPNSKPQSQFEESKVEMRINKKSPDLNTPATQLKHYKTDRQPIQKLQSLSTLAKRVTKTDKKSSAANVVHQQNNEFLDDIQPTSQPSAFKNIQESCLPVFSKEPGKGQRRKSPEATSQQEKSRLSSHLQAQRQAFIGLLRRVKNRGESLYLKLAKNSPERSSEKS